MITRPDRLFARWPVVYLLVLVGNIACSSTSTPSTVTTPATFAITSALSAVTGMLNAQNASRSNAGEKPSDGGSQPPSDGGSQLFEGTFTGPGADGCWNGTWADPDQSAYAVKLCPTPRWDQETQIDDAGYASFSIAATGTIGGPVREGSFSAIQSVRSKEPPLPDMDGSVSTDPDASAKAAFADTFTTTDGGGVMTDKTNGWTLRFTQTGNQTVTYDAGLLSMAASISFLAVVDAGQEFLLNGSMTGTAQVNSEAVILTGVIAGEFRDQGTVTARLRIDDSETASSGSSSPTSSMPGYYTLIDDNFVTRHSLTDAQIQAVMEKLLAMPF